MTTKSLWLFSCCFQPGFLSERFVVLEEEDGRTTKTIKGAGVSFASPFLCAIIGRHGIACFIVGGNPLFQMSSEKNGERFGKQRLK